MIPDGQSSFRGPPRPGGIPPPAGASSEQTSAEKVTLVGGLPWAPRPHAIPSHPVGVAAPVAAPPPPPAAASPPRPPPLSPPSAATHEVPAAAAAAAAGGAGGAQWLDTLVERDDFTEFNSWVQLLRDRVERWVRESPPFTVSLAAHAVLLVLLALWMIRDTREKKMRIELAFAAPDIVEAPDAGQDEVEVKVEEPEPEPEVAMTEEPPVEDPVAAPAAAEPEVTDAVGAEAAAERAPAVGMLLDGRQEGRREALLTAYGGSDATEAAVARALGWLVKQQNKQDGQWSLQGPYRPGASQENRLAATAMALLAFQGAGNTPTVGRHKQVVDRAWKGLLARQLPDGSFDVMPMPHHHSLYSHAQATIALCELYGMTRDPAFRKPAERAVAYAVAAQGPNGGWRYGPGQEGDMSVTGWYLMALKSAEMAGLDVPTIAIANLHRFVETVAVDDGARYGYRYDPPRGPADPDLGAPKIKPLPGPITAAVSAEGLLARQYLGWPRHDHRLVAGVELLLAPPLMDFDNEKDVYAWYYITQVVHHLGGEPWERWNGRMKDVLPATQVTTGGEAGSWDPALDKWGPWGGRLFMTCFCTYMLEVYYRHLPLYGDVHP